MLPTKEKMAQQEHEKLESEHLERMNKLYLTYYDMALNGNVSALNSFLALSKDFINENSEEGELEKILKGVRIDGNTEEIPS